MLKMLVNSLLDVLFDGDRINTSQIVYDLRKITTIGEVMEVFEELEEDKKW